MKKIKSYLFLYILAAVSLSVMNCTKKESTQPTTVHAEKQNDDSLVDYNFHIRPILSDKCFFCHGPDEKNNKGDLRLDNEESAFAKLKDSAIHGIVAGKPDESAVWQRINSDDPEKIMPPVETKHPLSTKEKNLIKKWIKQGAKYQPHWAFQALPKKIDTPDSTATSSWPKNKIDHFILNKLQQEKRSPSKEASPERWLRRASFDLTGLPSTETEVSNFLAAVKQDKEKAYNDAADRLLASKAYGEHQSAAWLDAARYADSYGFQSDLLNNQWPYRDWVISAFNKNLPYDTFLKWNLAGDLLENPTEEQRLATAFNRLHRLTNEGGSIREEFIAENAADRLHTFGTATLALTLECSRCHDHKYDPISSKDYYSLMGFFNSIPESGLYDHTDKVPSPSMLLPDPKQKIALKKAKDRLLVAEKSYRELVNKTQLPAEMKAMKFSVLGKIAHYSFDEDINSMTNHAPGFSDKVNASGLKQGEGKYGKSLVLDGDKGAILSAKADFDRHTPFSFSLWCKDKLQAKEKVVLLQKTYGTDVGFNGYDMLLENGHVEARLYRVWSGNGIGLRSKKPIAKNQWQLLTWTYDGSSSATGMQLFLNGKRLETETLGNQLLKKTSLRVFGSGALTIGQRFRDKGFAQGEVDDLQIFNRRLTELEVLHLYQPNYNGDATDAQKLEYYRHAINETIRNSLANLTAKRQHLVYVENGIREIPIMAENKTPRPTYILERGEYDSPKREDLRVQRDVFESILPRLPKDAPRDRLGLANWLTNPDHPLTSRVFVNRIWQNFFGSGIVSTAENFGLQGAIPSHPALLDWLAREFVSTNWDIKNLCKLIVLSATYRQDSAMTPALLEKDPENKLLARGPAYRLSAEQIRDLALFASGLMDKTIGGPPVSPYQPGKDLWKESNTFSPPYRQGTGKDLHRRSIYSVWKRTSPLPNMTAFDATAREVCTVARERTNTPLQALVLLNDVQFIEASRHLASTLKPAELSIQINEAFIRLTGKGSSARELSILTEIYNEQLKYYTENLTEAEKLINLGDSKPPQNLDKSKLAAMTIVCQAIMNLDATIWKR